MRKHLSEHAARLEGVDPRANKFAKLLEHGIDEEKGYELWALMDIPNLGVRDSINVKGIGIFKPSDRFGTKFTASEESRKPQFSMARLAEVDEEFKSVGRMRRMLRQSCFGVRRQGFGVLPAGAETRRRSARGRGQLEILLGPATSHRFGLALPRRDIAAPLQPSQGALDRSKRGRPSAPLLDGASDGDPIGIVLETQEREHDHVLELAQVTWSSHQLYSVQGTQNS